jgi:hypothetical protein
MLLSVLSLLCPCIIVRLATNYAKLGWNQVHALRCMYGLKVKQKEGMFRMLMSEFKFSYFV